LRFTTEKLARQKNWRAEFFCRINFFVDIVHDVSETETICRRLDLPSQAATTPTLLRFTTEKLARQKNWRPEFFCRINFSVDIIHDMIETETICSRLDLPPQAAPSPTLLRFTTEKLARQKNWRAEFFCRINFSVDIIHDMSETETIGRRLDLPPQ